MKFSNILLLPEPIVVLTDIKRKMVLKEFKNIFRFYYLANNEENLSNSFIKF